jgi:hypothetical protein
MIDESMNRIRAAEPRSRFITLERLSVVATWVLAVSSLGWLTAMIWWTLQGQPVIGMFSDSVWYLAIADYYRSLVGPEIPIHAQTAYDTSRFPPLYALLIAIVGGGMDRQDIVNHLSIGLTVVAGITVVAWLRSLGTTTLVAVSALPAVYVTPAILDWLLVPLSEPLFLACLAVTLVAAQRARKGALDITVVAALVSILPLVRSAGIVLAAAFAVWLVRMQHVSLARRVLAAGIATAPAILWALYRSTKPVFLDYGSEVSLARILEEGGTLGSFAISQFVAIAGAVQSWFGVTSWSPASVVIVALGVAACHGWWLRIRDWQLDAIFMPLYVGMLLVWPYPLEMPRLLGVTMPIVAAWAVLSVSHWITRQPTATRLAQGVALVATAGVVLSLPAWASMLQRASLPTDQALEPYKRTPAYFLAGDDDIALRGLETSARVFAVVDEASSIVPASECVFTTQTALAMAASRGKLKVTLTPKIDLNQPLAPQLAECRYLIVMQLGSRQAHAAPLYPLQEVRTVMEPVLVSKQDEAIAAALLKRTTK